MIGKKLQRLRLDKGFSQTELADEIGRSRQFIVNLESDATEPQFSDVSALAIALDIPPSQLLPESFTATRSLTQNPKPKIDSYAPPQEDKNLQEKFENVLLYILDKIGAKPNIGETAIYKILYFIDFDYYETNHCSVTGSIYIRNHFGPTPVHFKSAVDAMEKADKLVQVKNKVFRYEQRKYLPLKSANLSKISAAEKEHIDKIIVRYGDMNAKELSEQSHSDSPWQQHKQGDVISYESVFQRRLA